ncbi:MAG: hypothetical protein KME20_13670 [Kaiparowitsia implicata GSE-PSE-MK54-09C]|nr:hypothetical protein [Kaiparowitsia implicata GSE-PSE-MK54-09C]
MTHDVQQWLGEIKALQHKLADAHRERDEAFASAANWRSLYETEAKQRRADAKLAQQRLDELQEQLTQRVNVASSTRLDAARLQATQPNLAQPDLDDSPNESLLEEDTGNEVDGLKTALAQALEECDRLAAALQAEQQQHDQTRQGLTSALGDTMDLLTKERSRHNALINGTGVATPPPTTP